MDEYYATWLQLDLPTEEDIIHQLIKYTRNKSLGVIEFINDSWGYLKPLPAGKKSLNKLTGEKQEKNGSLEYPTDSPH
jgi:hypothetical protein